MSEPESARPPESVEELLRRYARGERSFRRLELSEAQLRRADLRAVDLHAADLALADLFEANLDQAHLRRARLVGADLGGASLEAAHLSLADLSRARLAGARLRGADLVGADLRGADFTAADLCAADLTGADLAGADLSGADLTSAHLRRAHLRATRLQNTRLDAALLGETALVDLDLSASEGLATVEHCYPSGVATSTLQRSGGRLPASFLRGCGLSEWEVELAQLYDPHLDEQEVARLVDEMLERRRRFPLRSSLVFVVYARPDEGFVATLEAGLEQRGIRSWRDGHDSAARGEGRQAARRHRSLERADQATLLLVLSGHSVASHWIAGVIQQAGGFGGEEGRGALRLLALDATWKDRTWPASVQSELAQERVADFSDWRDAGAFERQLQRLVDELSPES